jgi:hypothetical protein
MMSGNKRKKKEFLKQQSIITDRTAGDHLKGTTDDCF